MVEIGRVEAEPPLLTSPLLEHFTDGLTTAEAAALLARGPDPVPEPEGA